MKPTALDKSGECPVAFTYESDGAIMRETGDGLASNNRTMDVERPLRLKVHASVYVASRRMILPECNGATKQSTGTAGRTFWIST